MHNCVSVYACVYEERERIGVTLVTTAAQACESDLCMCARARVCSYYFANLSTVSLHLPVHTVTQTNSHTVLFDTNTLTHSALCMCARARVCSYYFANLSTVSRHLPVHTVTQINTLTHTHTSNTKNTGKYMSSNDRKSTLSLNHSLSVLSHEKHTHSPKR